MGKTIRVEFPGVSSGRGAKDFQTHSAPCHEGEPATSQPTLFSSMRFLHVLGPLPKRLAHPSGVLFRGKFSLQWFLDLPFARG
jgi:hypothetical protein